MNDKKEKQKHLNIIIPDKFAWDLAKYCLEHRISRTQLVINEISKLIYREKEIV